MITLGHIDFINMLPFELDGPAPVPFQKKIGPPTTINQKLLEGEVDLGVISLACYLDHKEDLVRLGNLGILSAGPVLSVVLFSNKDLSKVKGNGGLRVYETPQSATSIILNRIILQRAYGIDPLFVPTPAEAEAVLLIGNQALMEREKGRWIHLYDLGQEWRQMTGLPTVFAVLATHRRVFSSKKEELQEFVGFLEGRYRENIKNKELLVKKAREKINLEEKILYQYFDLLKYEIGPMEEKSILLFDQLRRR
jgi:chorismate dehydratase